MKKKLWLLLLLALMLLMPAGRAQAENLLISPGPGAISDKPDWYPADSAGFSFYSDPDALRVVDRADIFSEEEEAIIRQAIREQSARGNADIVVVTDASSYGMSHMQYADDFYDYNGYGFGESRDGILLFICMESGNRGWWTSVTGRLDPAVSTGPVLYTESVANTFDDALYDYLVAGRYAEGVQNWVGNVGTWLTYGVPYAPLWYPTVEEQAVWIRQQKLTEVPRIVDTAGLFSGDEAEALERKARLLLTHYGTDVVIHTAKSDYGMGREAYAQAFYQYGGYGLGTDYSGVLLVMYTDGSYDLYTEGTVPSCLSESGSVTRLLEQTADAAADKGRKDGCETYLNLLEKAFKKNKIPHSTGTWIMSAIFAAIAGLIPGGISRSSASASMKTVRSAFDSNDYLVEGSFRVDGGHDEFMGVTTTRVYNPPPQQKTGSSGGGGGSSYSSGHISSSGSSHSGSGRKF